MADDPDLHFSRGRSNDPARKLYTVRAGKRWIGTVVYVRDPIRWLARGTLMQALPGKYTTRTDAGRACWRAYQDQGDA